MAAALEPGPDPDAPQALGSRSETSDAPVLGRRAYLPYAPPESPDSCVQRRGGDPRQPARRVGGTDAHRRLRAAGVTVRPCSEVAEESDRRGRARVESVCRSEVASARVESVRLYRSRSAWTEGASEALVASIPLFFSSERRGALPTDPRPTSRVGQVQPRARAVRDAGTPATHGRARAVPQPARGVADAHTRGFNEIL